MRNVYICHPFADDPEGNIEKVKEFLRDKVAELVRLVTKDFEHTPKALTANRVYNRQSTPCYICPHFAFPSFMSEDGDVDREIALAFCLSLLSACDELWVCSKEITDGMKLEIEFASKNNIPVVFKA